MTVLDEVTYQHIRQAVAAAVPTVENGKGTLAERVHAHLWPYVEAAAVAAAAEGLVPETPEVVAPAPRDRRTRRWQITVRFWMKTPNGPELAAETDPEIIDGTGEIPPKLEAYCMDLHGGVGPELREDAVKERLPQLRNNLGRQGSAVLRVEYIGPEGAEWLCQTDVIRLND